MMGVIGRVISTSLENGKRFIKALAFGKNDRRILEEVSPFGVDAVPVRGLRAVIMETATKGEEVCIGYINENQQSEEGEYRIYSVDENGLQATYLWLKADGTIEIGGDADTAVKFGPLKTAFDQLQSDYNDLASKVNANSNQIATFAAAYVPGSPVVQGLPPTFPYGNQQGLTNTSDINPAEEPDIKLGN